MSHADPTERRDPVAPDDRRDDPSSRDDRGFEDRDRRDHRDPGSDARDPRDDRDRGPDDRDRQDDTVGRDDRDRADHASRSGGGTVGIDERWEATQAQFLESPREAVAAADELVSEVVDDVRRRLDAERAAVADSWKRDGADTEDLRTAMLRYREVLDRLGTQR